MQELLEIQQTLKAPKGQTNTFSTQRYRYRSCEDILEAVKPLLGLHKCTLNLSDDIVEVGGRVYVHTTATIENSQGKCKFAHAFAREEESKKGMDASQLTGATSSYARKYALNGLFAIDDAKDADTQDNTGHETPKKAAASPKEAAQTKESAIAAMDKCKDLQELQSVFFSLPPSLKRNAEVIAKKDEIKAILQNA